MLNNVSKKKGYFLPILNFSECTPSIHGIFCPSIYLPVPVNLVVIMKPYHNISTWLYFHSAAAVPYNSSFHNIYLFLD